MSAAIERAGIVLNVSFCLHVLVCLCVNQPKSASGHADISCSVDHRMASRLV